MVSKVISGADHLAEEALPAAGGGSR